MNVNENCGASLLMLGTGHATVTECYNTCFVLSVGRDRLLVDGGGGNGILTQFRKAGIGFGDLSAIFVTHAHTDHILGVVWALRMVCVHAFANPDFRIKVYGNSKCIGVLEYLCANLLAENYRAVLARAATFVTVADGDIVGVGEALSLRVFDMRSANEPQMGSLRSCPRAAMWCALATSLMCRILLLMWRGRAGCFARRFVSTGMRRGLERTISTTGRCGRPRQWPKRCM